MPVDEKPLARVVINSQALYGKEVNLNRAIPDLRDGLKPVQRRILYTAYKDHLTHTARYKKVATVSGDVLALHPHGDAAINDAMIPISQNWKVNVPLIDIHGNNGAVDGTGAAAPRYIEMRLTKPAELLLDGLEKDSVDIVSNYDGTKEEPTVLPASWPVVMTNGTSGIAFGLASNVVPHNPIELLNAAIHLVDDPDDKQSKLLSIIKGPDFPTGGVIIGKDSCREEIESGKVKYVIRGKAQLDVKKRQIVVSEVPYGVTTQALVESFGKVLEPQKQVLGVTKINDETTETPRIVIVFKKRTTKTQMETTLNLLYTDSKSLLQTSITTNNNLVWERRPGQFGIHQYLRHFLKFRSQVLVRVLKYDIKAAQARLNIVNGYLKMIDIVDQIIPVAKSSQNRDDLEQQLVKKFGFNQPQAHAISGIAVYRLGKQNVKALEDEQAKLDHELEIKQAVLGSKKMFLAFLKADLKHTLKFFDKPEYQRKTKIVEYVRTPKAAVDVDDLVKPEPIKVAVKSTGVLQQMTAAMYENSKDDPANADDIIAIMDTQTTNVVMGLTTHGLAYTRMAGDLPYQNLKSEPDSVQMTIPSYKRDDETLMALTFVEHDAKKRYIVSLTANGYLKIVNVSKVLPSLKTKGYLKRTTKYNGLKADGDYVVRNFVLTDEELAQATLHLSVNKKRTQDRDIKLSEEHVQGASGSGRRVFKLDPSNDEHFNEIELSGLPEEDKPSDDNNENSGKDVNEETETTVETVTEETATK